MHACFCADSHHAIPEVPLEISGPEIESFQDALSEAPLTALKAVFPSSITILTGNYGSGKTEVAVNLALGFARHGQEVHLIDLDFTKPCFRSRELRDLLQEANVNLVAPQGQLARADMPLVLPAVMPLLQGHKPGRVIVDLPGDPGGARTLAQFAPVLAERPHDLLLVVNTRRPFAGSVARIRQAVEELEAATRLPMTALVANTNLGKETRAEMVTEGFALTRDAAASCGIPVRVVVIPERLRGGLKSGDFQASPPSGGDVRPVPCIWLRRYVLPPWEAAPGN